MALFQSSVLKSHLARLNETEVDKAYKNYKTYFWNTTIQENIKNAKEEQFQATFLNELFVKILGYTLFPSPNSNLTTEFKNEKNNRKADGAILRDGVAIGVIELKGMNTKDLESIRQQAFDYKANHKECIYVITSNFEKLRFYINDATEFEEFDLFTLSRERFNLLYLCLHLNKVLTNIPLSIKEASIAKEEEITKTFYKDYSVFKRELYRDLVRRNSKTVKEKLSTNIDEEDQIDITRLEKNVKLNLFQKSQKLIDRFLFVFFAEDRMLLPANSTLQILNKWKNDWDFGDERPLYDLFKQYFNFLDTGRKGTQNRAEIYAYNGGLFKPDAILDALEIDSNLLYEYTLKLSNYDFESQVDVNILGHIFENSLNEIESVNAEIEGGEFDKQTSKRKKDGVFYTPKYITKYIVENTVGKLCTEKKEALGFEEEQYFKSRKKRNKDTLKGLVQILDDYRDWLLELTICDPACGSGAFLNQALDFLIKEHSYIDELKARVLGGGLQFPDIENTILENNIYGVDLNDESVEIAKLSLWLRTAQPRRKLNDLSSNVKCGNSLIDDKKVAGDKAFNWEREFPDVFEKGGFDVVIGNRLYGAGFSKDEIIHLNNNYKHQSYQLDSYLLFTEKTIDLIKKEGYIGYIMPNTWLSTLMTNTFRKFVFSTFKIETFVHYDYFVFDDATVETDTYIFKYPFEKGNIIPISIQSRNSILEREFNQDDWIKMDGKPVNINQSSQALTISVKLEKFEKLGNLVEIVQGTKPFQKGKGIPKQTAETMKLKPFVQATKKDNTFLPLLRGSLINRYKIFWNNDYWISYGDWLAEPRYSAKFDSKQKLVVRQTGDSIIAAHDNQQFICRDNLYVIRDDKEVFNLLDILAILNSKFITWYYRNILNPEQGKAMAQVKRGHLQEIPIPKYENDVFKFSSEKMMTINGDLLLIENKFLNYLTSSLSIIDFSRKLQNWHELDFGDFIKELNKAIKSTNKERAKEELEAIPTLTKKDEFEWMELFEENKKKAVELQGQIDATEKEIDQMVYELYGLSEEEIRIVENS